MVEARKRGAIEGGRGYCLHADSVPKCLDTKLATAPQ